MTPEIQKLINEEAEKHYPLSDFIVEYSDEDVQEAYIAGATFLMSLLEQQGWVKKAPPGEFYHDLHCNASRKEPQGNSGCSCFMVQVKSLTAQLSDAQKKIKELEMWFEKYRDRINESKDTTIP